MAQQLRDAVEDENGEAFIEAMGQLIAKLSSGEYAGPEMCAMLRELNLFLEFQPQILEDGEMFEDITNLAEKLAQIFDIDEDSLEESE